MHRNSSAQYLAKESSTGANYFCVIISSQLAVLGSPSLLNLFYF